MALSYGDTLTDTRQFPAAAAGGSGLTVGGSIDPAAPVALYVDYLDVNGNVLAAGGAAPANWYYMRAWEVTQVRPNLKRIRVISRVNALSLGGPGLIPQSVVSVLKTSPF